MSPCDKCGGACCRYVVIQVGELTPERREWAETRGTIEGDMYRIRSKCCHLTRQGFCKIYPNRPGICKQYRVNSALCVAARAAWNVAKKGGSENGKA